MDRIVVGQQRIKTMSMLATLLLLIAHTVAFVPSSSVPASSIILKSSSFVEGPPAETKPDYEKIHGPLGKTMDGVFHKLFRTKMAEAFGMDSDLPVDDYQGLMELTAAMNARYSDQTKVQRLAQNVLCKSTQRPRKLPRSS